MASGVRRAWHALVLHDHWQGEACVAVFGAILFTVICLVSPDGQGYDRPGYALLRMTIPEWLCESLFLAAGIGKCLALALKMQMVRLVCAVIIMALMTMCMTSVALTDPWAPGLAGYVVCIAIEGCAMIYLTAEAVRNRRLAQWKSGRL